MSLTMCVAVALTLARATAQAIQCSSHGECPSDGKPQNAMLLLQAQMNLDGGINRSTQLAASSSNSGIWQSTLQHNTPEAAPALGAQVHAPYRDLGDLCPKHPEMAKYRYLAVVSQFDGNVSWANKLTFPHSIYSKGDDTEDFVAINRGMAETNIPKFFAQFYNCLPEFTIVLHQDPHGGSSGFRGSDTVAVVNDPVFESKVQQHNGYWNFDTSFKLGTILNEAGEAMQTSGWWSATMEPWFGRFEEHGDFTIGHPCCAQFVVSRQRIQRLPREFFQNMYSWFATNSADDCATRNDHNAGTKTRRSDPKGCYMTSRYLEFTWHLIFSKSEPAIQ